MIHEEKSIGSRFTLLAGDCLEVLKTLGDTGFEMTLTKAKLRHKKERKE